MTKKMYKFSFFILVLLTSGLVKAKSDQPNFLWIIAEDSSKHYYRLYDEQGAVTPNIEALAEDGYVFNNAFSNAPVCSTARSVLAMGIYNPRLGTHNHRVWQRKALEEGIQPLSTLLKDAGYYTTNNFKTDYNFEGADEFWHQNNESATWRKRAKGQAFFHVQTWKSSHEGRSHFPETDIGSKATSVDHASIKLPSYLPDTEVSRYTYARYLDSIKKVDAQIGQTIDQLKEDGLLEDTFVFVFGDHGGVLPFSKGYVYDRGLHVPLVVRVPEKYRHLLHDDFSITQKGRLDGVVSFVDFAPTLMTLAGLDPADYHDGSAFLGKKVSMKTLNSRKKTFSYADRFDEKSDLVRAIRIGKYKYIRSFEPFNPDALYNAYRYKQIAYQDWMDLYKQGKLTQAQAQFFRGKPVEALYDVEADPDETRNLALQKNYKKRLKYMRAELVKKMKSIHDLGVYPESYLEKDALSRPIQFGIENKSEINRLIDIAQLELKPYKKTKKKLERILKKGSVWERYWAIIVASSYGDEAKDMYALIDAQVSKSDPNILKARKYQFCFLINKCDDPKLIENLIADTSDDLEALEVMNIAAQLKGMYGFNIDVSFRDRWYKPEPDHPNFEHQMNKHYMFVSRTSYLSGEAK